MNQVSSLYAERQRLRDVGEHQFDFRPYLVTLEQIATRIPEFFTRIKDVPQLKTRITIYNAESGERIVPTRHDQATLEDLFAWEDEAKEERRKDADRSPTRRHSLNQNQR